MLNIKKGDFIKPSLANEPIRSWVLSNASGSRYPFYTFAKFIDNIYEAATDSSFVSYEYTIKIFIDKKPIEGQKLRVEKVKENSIVAKVV